MFMCVWNERTQHQCTHTSLTKDTGE